MCRIKWCHPFSHMNSRSFSRLLCWNSIGSWECDLVMEISRAVKETGLYLPCCEHCNSCEPLFCWINLTMNEHIIIWDIYLISQQTFLLLDLCYCNWMQHCSLISLDVSFSKKCILSDWLDVILSFFLVLFAVEVTSAVGCGSLFNVETVTSMFLCRFEVWRD
jgi:hypothetical protein